MAQSVRDALMRLQSPRSPPTHQFQATPRRSERLKPKLFKLPREIRNQIYRLVVLKEKPILIVRFAYQNYVGGRFSYFNPFPRQPNLARTCRQIRDEALSIYYSENWFMISQQTDNNIALLHRFRQWRTLIRHHAAFIRRIGVLQHHGRDLLDARAKTAGPSPCSTSLQMAPSGAVSAV